MSLYLFAGQPIWVNGARAAINETVPVPADAVTAGASAADDITWGTIPDIVLTVDDPTYDLKAFITATPGLPYSVALSPSSAALQTGVSLGTDGVLTYDGASASDTVTGIIARTTTGAGAGIADTAPVPQDALAATAGGPDGGPSGGGAAFGDINDAAPVPVDHIAALANQDPLPIGAGYPTYYTQPSLQEAVFSDVGDPDSGLYNTGTTYYRTFQMKNHPGQFPGNYAGRQNAAVMWKNIGGDWKDANNVPLGTTAIVSGFVEDLGSAVEQTIIFDVTAAVRSFVNGTRVNYGFFLKTSDNGVVYFRSRFNGDSTKNPKLVVQTTSAGTVTIPCGRTLWVNNSSDTSKAGSSVQGEMRTSKTSDRTLVWADHSSLLSAADIISATLVLVSHNQFGVTVSGFGNGSMVDVFYVSNPEDPATNAIDDQHLGLAAGYTKDAGIDAHPDVLLSQQFTDAATYKNLWVQTADQYAGATSIVTAADGNGFTPLAGTYNALRCRFKALADGGQQLAFQAFYPIWRGPGTLPRLKTVAPAEDLYLRYYLMWGNDWDPYPDGGKMPGFDGRYTTLKSSEPTLATVPGCGRGNSGTGADGLCGWSARGNFDRRYTPGSPIENFRGLGSADDYVPDMTNFFGTDWYTFRNNYLGFMRKGQWNCIEVHVSMNSVTQPAQVQRRITSCTHDGSGFATATLASAETDPLYATGQIWSMGGFSASTGVQYSYNQGGVPITVIDSTHFKYPVPTTTAATASAYVPIPGNPALWFTCVPGVGNFDGVLEAWVNGRQVMRDTTARFRHARYVPDSSTFLGVDAVWMTAYHGGTSYPAAEFSCYIANVVVARSYIGPMVGYP